jgi:hypothetical protein
MSERAEMLRQDARAEAAEREQRLALAMRIQDTHYVPRGRGNVAYGETACPRCGVRSGIGCAHRPAGDTTTKITSFLRRSGMR